MSNWDEKRLVILNRDNYTCRNCGQFNPELGTVEFNDKIDGHVEIHVYTNHPDPYQADYSISQSRTGFTFHINFGNCWPVFPIMQVHHKKYINGKEKWDYENDDLITLCKKCHFNFHLNEVVPIYSTDNILLEEKMFLPVDTGLGRKHNCDEWTFIQLIGGGEYVLSDIKPTITMVIFDNENKIDAETEAKSTLDKFITNYFPRYSQKK